mgnify:CR=1 FL=1|tara:strand:- start:117 stop:485 length:369 start_codon:yes stop_codon:yes gene_type:complete
MFNTKKFKELRRKKNITVNDLAIEIGSTKSTVYHYQSGNMQPSQNFIDKISEYFEVPATDFITTVKENPYRDALVKELKSEVDFLKQMIGFLTDGKVKNVLAKFKGNLKTVILPYPALRIAR